MRLAIFTAVTLSALAQAWMIQGFDLSGDSWSQYPEWAGAYKDGARFVTVLATDGSLNIAQFFREQFHDAKQHGFFRAAYHEARPSQSSGKQQAEHFLENGGRWIEDNITLPGILEITGPFYGPRCWGLNAKEMVDWVNSWTGTYSNASKQLPTVRTNITWWNECTNYDDSAFSNVQLGVIDWKDDYIDGNNLPYGTSWTFWQNNPWYKHGGMSDMFHGTIHSLKSMAVDPHA